MKTYSELNRIPTEGEEIKVLSIENPVIALSNKYIGVLNKTGKVTYRDEEIPDCFLTNVICEINNEEFFFTLDEIGPVNQ